MYKKLYAYRFEFFFFSQMAILFGSLMVSSDLFESTVSQLLFYINILSGILLISKKKKTMWFLVFLLVMDFFVFGSSYIENRNVEFLNFMRMTIYFLYYIVIIYEIIKQVWKSKKVGKNVILGLVSGYVGLGLIGFFICLSIEMAIPNSFQMLHNNLSPESTVENLMYFSYITLLTIGYGDVIPLTALAHKSAILIGLVGQMYLVIVTAIVVGKYINQLSMSNKD